MRFYLALIALLLVSGVHSLSGQTAAEVLQRGAQVVSGAQSFSGRAWGCTHTMTTGGMSLFTAYELLHRRPGDWMLISMNRRSLNDRQFNGDDAQGFVYTLATGEQKRGGWSELDGWTFTDVGGGMNMSSELHTRLGMDPFLSAYEYWHANSDAPFDWQFSDVVLLPDELLGTEPVWHIVAKNRRNQEVHFWFGRQTYLPIRSVVVERKDDRLLRVAEWYYDTLFNLVKIPDQAFTNPQRLPYDQPMTIESMNLTEVAELAVEFKNSPLAADAVAPEETPEQPAAPISQKLTPKQMEAIVLIESGDGQASGFLTKLRGVDFVVTNLHVLGEEPQLLVRNLNGETLSVQGVFGAVGRDIAIIRVGATYGDLSPIDSVLGQVEIGDAIVVVGNRRGGRVATQIEGRVLGVGPGRIEVDAKFEPGNSGSPVVHLKTGRVIGVATYSQTREIDESDDGDKNATSKRVEQRWFAYRIDGISQWESIDLARWKAQYQQIKEFYEDTESLYEISQVNLESGKASPRLRPYIESFEEKAARYGRGSVGLASEAQNFMSNMRARSRIGIKELQKGEFYDYFRTSLYWRTNISQQLEYRDWVIERIEQMNSNVDSWHSKLRN